MPQPPTGTVTFLFTDIEGSTRLWQQHPDEMPAALRRHHALLHEAIAAHGGYVFQIIGDAFCAAFTTASNGLAAALDAQRLLASEAWGATGPIRVRMALHSGKAEVQVGEFISGEYASGLTLSRAARLLSAGHGGQVLLSLASAELVRDHLPPGASLRDCGARRLKDLIRPEQIFQLQAPGLQADFPPLRTLDVHPHNLPVQLTSFIGREREMGEIKKLLAGTHLLTLTGVGGTGKTRLSLQVAADLIDDYPGGVYLVELAPLRDPALVEQTVASVLEVREQPGRPLSELLVEELREKQVLLLLDNCEHVIDACARLADLLLHSAPGLKILATSRAPLNISGETSYPVPPLALPDPARPALPGALAQYEAVRLFSERAVAVQPTFAVTNANAPAVAQICTHLDGIPLAIELAAARSRLLSPEQIAARLSDRFHLLTGGSRASLPRQQTLQAAIDWSYDLLSAAEQALFNRLAVFAGSFSLEAVEAICADDDKVPSAHVLDLLGALVDHSLVVVQEREAEMRYTLLETVRQYAQEKLYAYGEWPALQDRHLAYYRKLAEEGEPHTWSGRPEWMARFEREYDNFRLAINFARENNLESFVLIVKDLAMFLDLRHHKEDLYNWAIEMPSLTRERSADRIRMLALWLAGSCRGENREYEIGIDLIKQSIAIAHIIGDKSHINNAVRDLWLIAQFQGKWAEVTRYANQNLALSLELGDQLGVAGAQYAIGLIAFQSGDFQTGREYLENSLERYKTVDSPNGVAFALARLHELYRLQGNLLEAKRLCLECLDLRRQMGHHNGVLYCLISLDQMAVQAGEKPDIDRMVNEILVIARDDNALDVPIYCLANLAGAAGNAGLDTQAAQFFGAMQAASESFQLEMDVFDRMTYDPIIATVRTRLGEERFQAEWEAGKKLTLEQALELAQQL